MKKFDSSYNQKIYYLFYIILCSTHLVPPLPPLPPLVHPEQASLFVFVLFLLFCLNMYILDNMHSILYTFGSFILF